MFPLRRRLTYANVMATIAVFIALGGTSYAALVVTSKNVKNGSLKSADIKNNSLTGRDIKNKSLKAADFRSALPSGATGPAGAKGDKGDKGERGVPGPVTGDLPSGVTLRGAWGVDYNAASDGALGQSPISFGVRLPSAPTVTVRPPSAAATSACPGTAANPEAAPGNLCLYQAEANNVESVSTYKTDVSSMGASRHGALVIIDPKLTGNTYTDGAWAVTAR